MSPGYKKFLQNIEWIDIGPVNERPLYTKCLRALLSAVFEMAKMNSEYVLNDDDISQPQTTMDIRLGTWDHFAYTQVCLESQNHDHTHHKRLVRGDEHMIG